MRDRSSLFSRIAAAAAVLTLLFSLPALAEDLGESEKTLRTITVTGTATETTDPDYAQILYAVTTQASEAADCQSQNSASVSSTIDILKELGVQESSISTEFNMNPTYDWSSSDQRITGYQATTTITVSDIVLDSLGSILAESVKTGVNTVQGINYYSSSFDEAYQKALAKALKMARGKAEALSEELALAEGCELGGIQSISESNYNDSQRYAMKSANLAVAETAADADMGTGAAISPGTITVKAQITVVYAIK